MPLRARVGRHANTGKHCQNWQDDQQKVIDLLNRIPITKGGAEGSIKDPVVAGTASQSLYTAILYFQNKHFPGTPSGFVDPGGPVLARMETLAASAVPAAPAKPGQWDTIQSSSVDRALRKALAGDNSLAHPEVVDIIRATLSDGTISAGELSDLSTISAVSRSLETRTRTLLNTFIWQVKNLIGGKGPYYLLSSDKHIFAADMVCDFLKRKGKAYFTRLDRDVVGVGMLMRIAKPGLMAQENASLCGPASLLYGVASDNPVMYARFGIDLYEKGAAKLYRLVIEPGKDVRSYKPDPDDIHPTDWMTMASIRDSENWFLDYDATYKEAAGMTLPGELSHWLRLAGYSDVQEETNLVANKDVDNIDDANRLFAKGYRICLFISDNVLYATKQTTSSPYADHWVVQRSPIDRTGGKIKLTVFTWGQGERQVPAGADLSVDDFLDNFYGYVAGKP